MIELRPDDIEVWEGEHSTDLMILCPSLEDAEALKQQILLWQTSYKNAEIAKKVAKACEKPVYDDPPKLWGNNVMEDVEFRAT